MQYKDILIMNGLSQYNSNDTKSTVPRNQGEEYHGLLKTMDRLFCFRTDGMRILYPIHCRAIEIEREVDDKSF